MITYPNYRRVVWDGRQLCARGQTAAGAAAGGAAAGITAGILAGITAGINTWKQVEQQQVAAGR